MNLLELFNNENFNRFIRLIILLITMTVILATTATKFDYTEIRAIILIFLGAASAEGAIASLRRRKERKTGHKEPPKC